MREFCQREGYGIAGVYRDGGQSGSTTQRKDLLRLIEDARKKRFDAVLIFRVDRFSRDPVDLLALVRELETKNIKLRSVTEAVDASDPAGELMLTILGAIGKFVRQNIIQNAMLGKTKRAQSGKFTGGKVPFGFKVDENGIYLLDDQHWWNGRTAAEVAGLVFETYLRLSREGAGCKSVADELNRLGIPGPKTVWATAAIYQMLTNPCYVGDFAYNKRSHNLNKPSKMNDKDDWVVVAEAHEPIIDRGVWNEVQESLKRNRTHGGRRADPGKNLLLVGFLKCGECGAALSARYSTAGPYVYYTCLSRYSERRRREGTACQDFPFIPADQLETMVWNSLVETSQSEDRIREIQEHMYSSAAPDLEKVQEEVSRLEKRLAGLEQQSMTLTTAYAEGKMPEYLWQKQLERVERDRTGVQERLDEAQGRLAELQAQVPVVASVKEIQAYLLDVLANRTTLEKKREALTILIGHRGIKVMKNGGIRYEAKIPLSITDEVAVCAEPSVPTRPEL